MFLHNEFDRLGGKEFGRRYGRGDPPPARSRDKEIAARIDHIVETISRANNVDTSKICTILVSARNDIDSLISYINNHR